MYYILLLFDNFKNCRGKARRKHGIPLKKIIIYWSYCAEHEIILKMETRWPSKNRQALKIIGIAKIWKCVLQIYRDILQLDLVLNIYPIYSRKNAKDPLQFPDLYAKKFEFVLDLKVCVTD